ncbi:hypothetical protein AVEN_120686-1 [Araneus ventricosus]|uniref:Uncharacterized protein n=1 Tax=Araneus ventricosus TaxID=182803 RepID=A0A4Y2W846_ARAVE|nr:hypothetical protein AVEN_120686-1 [Araneus ventricosus]
MPRKSSNAEISRESCNSDNCRSLVFMRDPKKAQLEDPAIKPILEKKLNSWNDHLAIAPESPATKRYWALWDPYTKDGSSHRNGK